MADGSVPIVLSPEPFSRAVAYLEQPAGRTLKGALVEAVRAGSISADDLSRTVVYVDGVRLGRDETLDHVLQEGQVVNIVVEPLGGGGGRKEVGQILMTIVVIAVSMWVGGPAGAAALGSTLLAQVAAAAILTLGQAAVAALFAPDAESKAKANERYALQTASNQYRPWAPFPLAIGEVICAPDFAAKTFTQAIGDDVWIYGILGLHYGACEVDELKIGDTLVSSMGAGDFRMAQHLTPGPRDFSIYPNDTDQLDLQEELEATTGAATPVIRAASAEGELFEFDFFLPGGLHFQKDDGRVIAASVTLTVRYRPVDEDGVPTGDASWAPGLTIPLTSTTKEPWRIMRSLALPLGRYEFEFTRSLKPDANEKRRDDVGLTAIRAIAFRKPVADETLSIIEFAVRATALNQGTLAPITCRLKPLCETWDGAAWTAPVATSNPAALTRWLLTGPAPARPLQPEQADVRLRAWSALCEEYDWNVGIYLTDDRRQADVMGMIEQAGRASLWWDGTQIVASAWVEKPAPRQLFTGSNLKDHRWTIIYPEPVHALRVEFANIDEGGDPDELFVYADGYAEVADPEAGLEAATLVEALRIEGQKTAERAYRDGRWELGARLHRRRVDTWTADVEHLVSGYGDRVRLAWQRVEGATSSRVRCRRWTGELVTGLRLAQPVEMVPGESYAVDIRLAAEVVVAVPIINPADDAPVITREIEFAVPREPGSSPKRDDLVAFGVPTRISEDTEIIGIEPGEGLTASITGVRYVAPLLMAGETGPIPPLQTRLTRQRQANPPTPRLLGVQADPAGVRVSFDMPPWAGSPIVGFSARWRPTPPEGEDAGWQTLSPLAAEAREGLIPSPRAVPVAAGDEEGRNLVDYELRAITASGQTSPVPMTLTAIEVREDPFRPLNLTVTPAVRVAPGGSSHGVLVAAVDPLAAGVGIDVILEVRRAPLTGAPDAWESAGLPLTSVNPTGDILGLRSGERYGVRAALRSPAGWTSLWTDEVRATVPAGSNVSDDTAYVDGVAADLFVNRVIDVESLAAANAAAVSDLETVYGDTVSAAASALEADASAGNAYLSMIGAQTAEAGAASSASSAVTNAGIAATKATEASNSATAASASQVSAASAYQNVIKVTHNGYFDQGEDGWDDYGDVYPEPANSGRTNILRSVAGVNGVLRSSAANRFPIRPGENWRLSIGFRTVAAADALVYYAGLFFLDADGALVAGSDGTGNYPLAAAAVKTVADGWQDRSVLVGPDAPASPYGGTSSFPAGAVAFILVWYYNYYADATGVAAIDYFTAEPATGEVGSLNSASAAATSASSAATSSSAAGASATAASGSATTATTAAGSASTFASQASTSANNAASSASSAGTSASTATGAAATATTQASNASASAAEASSFASIAAGVNSGALNSNAGFDSYPTTTGAPAGWGIEAGSAAWFTRVNDPVGGYAVRIDTPAGSNSFISNYSANLSPDSWYIVEAEVFLESGGLEGAGCYFPCYNADLTFGGYGYAVGVDYLPFHTTLETSTGAVVGNGVVGRRYRFTRLLKTHPDAGVARTILYAMGHWSGLGSIAAANGVRFEKCLIRLASPQEIDQQKVFSTLGATVSAQATAMQDLVTGYSLARYTVSATTPGGAAILSLVSSSYGTVAGLSADKIYFGGNTFFDDATDTMRTTMGGSVRVVAYGSSFGTDGQLTEWEGPAATAFASMSRANAYFYRANVAPFAGGSAITPSTGGGGATASGSADTGFIAGSGWTTFKTFTVTGVPGSAQINCSMEPGVSTTSGGTAHAEWRLIQTSGGAVVAGPVVADIGNLTDDAGFTLSGLGTASGSVSYSLQGRIISGSSITNTPFQIGFQAYQVI